MRASNESIFDGRTVYAIENGRLLAYDIRDYRPTEGPGEWIARWSEPIRPALMTTPTLAHYRDLVFVAGLRPGPIVAYRKDIAEDATRISWIAEPAPRRISGSNLTLEVAWHHDESGPMLKLEEALQGYAIYDLNGRFIAEKQRRNPLRGGAPPDHDRRG